MLECEMAGPRGIGPLALGSGGSQRLGLLGLGCWGPSAPRPWALVTGGDSKGEIFKDDASRGLGMVSFADLPLGASRETLAL